MKQFKYLSLCLIFGLLACDKQDAEPKFDPVKFETVKDIAANPSDAPTPNYVFYSFENGLVSIEDSATDKWDLAFRSTSILVNGGSSGPGTGTATITDGIFNDFASVPSTLNLTSDSSEGTAIPTGSGNGWYSYNPANHQISPLAGKVIFVKTSNGNYAKVEMLSYYKGAPSTIDEGAIGRYITFRYAYQPNGSSSFE